MVNAKLVCAFTEGRAGMKALLGGKGANLAEMTRAGLPVPLGFTITTEAYHTFLRSGYRVPVELQRQVQEAL